MKNGRRFASRDAWRAWLAENHATATEIWLVFHKKHTRRSGLAKVREAKANGQWEKAALREDTTQVPPELTAALARNEKARRHFATLAPSYRKQFIYWVASAKREDTRQKRIAETVRRLATGKRLGTE